MTAWTRTDSTPSASMLLVSTGASPRVCCLPACLPACQWQPLKLFMLAMPQGRL